jgi:hypothetical protein
VATDGGEAPGPVDELSAAGGGVPKVGEVMPETLALLVIGGPISDAET